MDDPGGKDRKGLSAMQLVSCVRLPPGNAIGYTQIPDYRDAVDAALDMIEPVGMKPWPAQRGMKFYRGH